VSAAEPGVTVGGEVTDEYALTALLRAPIDGTNLPMVFMT
jgi:hypothetical protein